MSQQPNRNNFIPPLSQWKNDTLIWSGVNNTNNNNNKTNTSVPPPNRGLNWKDHNNPDTNGTYIMSSDSDWVMSTARRCTIHYGCTNCYSLNFSRRVGITENADGTYTTHFHFCSAACKNFNKRQNYFAYQFGRGNYGGDNIYGPRQTDNVEAVNNMKVNKTD